MVSPQVGASVSLAVVLKKGQTSLTLPAVTLADLSPDKPVFGRVAIPPGRLTAGTYEIWIKQANQEAWVLAGQTLDVH